MRWTLALLVVAVLALHQDTWFWNSKALVFGFLPMGLAYHAMYCILAAMLMSTLVLHLWPVHLDEEEQALMAAEATAGKDEGSR